MSEYGKLIRTSVPGASPCDTLGTITPSVQSLEERVVDAHHAVDTVQRHAYAETNIGLGLEVSLMVALRATQGSYTACDQRVWFLQDLRDYDLVLLAGGGISDELGPAGP
jgi:hypothetical protein